MFPDSNIARLARVFWGSARVKERESREHKRLPHTSLPFAAQSLARASPTKAPATLSNAGYWQDLQCRPACGLWFESVKFRLNISRWKNRDVAASNLDVVHRKQNTGSVTQKASLTQNPRKPHTPCPFSLSVFTGTLQTRILSYGQHKSRALTCANNQTVFDY